MPKATKHATKATNSGPTISQSSSQRSIKAKAKITQAPAKTAKKTQKKAAIPIKDASKLIKKGAKAVPISKENKPPVSGKSKAQRPSAPPKKSLSSYNFFNGQMTSQMKTMDKFKNLSFAEKSKVISESWAKLTDEQKQQYVDLADEDKLRYQKECKQFEKKGFFINKDGKDSRDLFKPAKVKKAEDQEMQEVEKKPAKAEKQKPEDDVTKPKKVLSAFICFSNQNRSKLMKEQPDRKITEIAKLNGEHWGKLTDAEKKPFEKMQQEDLKRFEKETQQFHELGYFINSDGIKSTFLTKKGKAQEFEIGTVMPKKVSSTYMLYLHEYYANNKKKSTDEKVDVVKNVKVLAEKWNEMSSKQKQKYAKQQQKDQERYHDQLDQLRKNGYFTTEAGVKSTDLPQKQKKSKKAN